MKINTFWQMLAGWILGKIDWTINGEFPALDKFIIVVAPHERGAFEVLLGWCVKELRPIPPPRFLAKAEAYYSPAWPILKWLGGYPIDRKNTSWFHRLFRPSEGYIPHLVHLMKREKRRSLVILPEGTRKRVSWQRGFYEIAVQTSIPVVLVGFDYRRRMAVIAPEPISMTGDPSDLDQIRDWYRSNVSGYEPKLDLEKFFKL